MVQVHLTPPLRSPGLANPVRGSCLVGFPQGRAAERNTFFLAQPPPLSLALWDFIFHHEQHPNR